MSGDKTPPRTTWTPEQFWEYVAGLAGDFESSQMNAMLAERGLLIAPVQRSDAVEINPFANEPPDPRPQRDAAGTFAGMSQLDDASNACLELAAKHGFATGHGDTVADMIREFSAQIPERHLPFDADIEAVADAIDNARYQHPEYPRERPRPFADADRSDREYALRLARAALALPSAQRNSEGGK